MIRALAISLCLAVPATAQTPVEISAANDLRVCLLSAQGFRDATRLAQLEESLEQIRARNWGQLTEIAPGVFRMARNGTDRTVEIKLPDASGAAHCMAFGPSIRPGLGALTADKFVELNFMPGLSQAPAPQGMSRRYNVTEAPYQVDLIAYTAQAGDVVGFVFSGIPAGQSPRTSLQGDPSVRPNLTLAITLCSTGQAPGPVRAGWFRGAGFAERVERSGSNSDTTHFFTAPGNTVIVELYYGEMPEDCRVMSSHIGVTAASAILDSVIPQHFPNYQRVVNQGPIDPATGQPATCVRYEQPGSQIPHVIGIYAGNGAEACVENGTVVIFDAHLV